MRVSMKFDMKALEREIQQKTQALVRDLASQTTRELDNLRHKYEGQPVDVIKPELQRIFCQQGGSITDPELTEWAQMIAVGKRIVMKPGQVRL
jgi:hypothetical protein